MIVVAEIRIYAPGEKVGLVAGEGKRRRQPELESEDQRGRD